MQQRIHQSKGETNTYNFTYIHKWEWRERERELLSLFRSSYIIILLNEEVECVCGCTYIINKYYKFLFITFFAKITCVCAQTYTHFIFEVEYMFLLG